MAAGIDRYLIHSFEALQDDTQSDGYMQFAQKSALPMLVRVAHASAIEEVGDAQDCRITSILGNIVACVGSMKTVEALEKNPRVLSVEGGRPSSGHDCSASIPFVRADLVHNDARHPEKGDHAIVAVIDGG
jgi:hypothetical protein